MGRCLVDKDMAAQLLDLPGRMRHWEARIGFGFFNMPVLQGVLNPPSWSPWDLGKHRQCDPHRRGRTDPVALGIQSCVLRQCSIPAAAPVAPAVLCPQHFCPGHLFLLSKGTSKSSVNRHIIIKLWG